MKTFRILLPSSSGGHLTEIFQLKELLDATEHLFVTEDLPLARKLLSDRPCRFVRPNGRNRNWIFWGNFLINWFLAVPIIMRFRPHAIVTTGSHTAIPFCYIGKLMGCKIIFVLSFCRIDSKAAAASAIYPIADLFFVQWPQMRALYPKSIYVGPLF
ncbi:MAG TPA: PssD/Cps14F family polysaccharide biosynthesis glycosyltransferase [Candidatus Binataceae bacterium]|nr:PssD/Cps14F family polysaccharide biosynthesis glycosyltransferase [Candidatus Binataceae bacterium]